MLAKSAIITGSTSGIGKGIATILARSGINIMLNGFGPEADIKSLQHTLAEEYDVEVEYSPADMTKPDEIHAMVDQAKQAFGHIDILVNNAGVQHVDRIEHFPPKQWDAILDINLSAAFHTIAAVIPGMQQKKWGRIINIASAHGLVASAKKAGYVAAKHGITGLTKVVALENAGSGITCNAICPGWVLTPLVQKQIDAIAERDNIPVEQAKLQLLSEKQPSKEFVTIEEIGALTYYLCGDLARSITGSCISIDGGWTAQ